MFKNKKFQKTFAVLSAAAFLSSIGGNVDAMSRKEKKALAEEKKQQRSLQRSLAVEQTKADKRESDQQRAENIAIQSDKKAKAQIRQEKAELDRLKKQNEEYEAKKPEREAEKAKIEAEKAKIKAEKAIKKAKIEHDQAMEEEKERKRWIDEALEEDTFAIKLPTREVKFKLVLGKLVNYRETRAVITILCENLNYIDNETIKEIMKCKVYFRDTITYKEKEILVKQAIIEKLVLLNAKNFSEKMTCLKEYDIREMDIISDGNVNICDSVFEGNLPYIKKLTIKGGEISIGKNAFRNNSCLKECYIETKSRKIELDGNVFDQEDLCINNF